jgi:hypothetical protein
MPADADTLLTLANALHQRAEDLDWVGSQLVTQSGKATWQCAKGDRYRSAMQARKVETHTLAVNLNDIAKWVHARSVAAANAATAAAAPAAPPPGA